MIRLYFAILFVIIVLMFQFAFKEYGDPEKLLLFLMPYSYFCYTLGQQSMKYPEEKQKPKAKI